MAKLSRILFRAARRTRDVEVIAGGSPTKMARRIRNKVLGQGLARLLEQLWLS